MNNSTEMETEGTDFTATNAPNDDNPQQQEVKSKRIQQPRATLNAIKLKEKRGLPALKDVFADVKFKGKNCEEEDLQTLMFRYEYWCHKLFNKLPFDNCLEKIEDLGSQKSMRAYITKVRMDIVDDEDIPTNEINMTENND